MSRRLDGPCKDLEEKLIVQRAQLALGGRLEKLGRHVCQGAQVAACMLTQGVLQLVGHQLDGPGLFHGVIEKVAKLLRRVRIEDEACAHPAVEREQVP